MTTVYWGDGGISTVDGNWNNAGNWFSATTPDDSSPGTPYGQVPQPGDSVVLTEGPIGHSADITTGPTGGWSGPISTFLGGVMPSDIAPRIANGNYSGPITLAAMESSGNPGITGGTFSGSVTLQASVLTGGAPAISGGTFTGTVTRANPNTTSTIISGGTYSPSASCALGPGNILSDANLPEDPGFAVGGGIFSPVITVTGIKVGTFPVPNQVLRGTLYGPNGNDFVGILFEGGAGIRTTELEILRLRRQLAGARARLQKRSGTSVAAAEPSPALPVSVPIVIEREHRVLVPQATPEAINRIPITAPLPSAPRSEADEEEDELALLTALEEDRRRVIAAFR